MNKGEVWFVEFPLEEDESIDEETGEVVYIQKITIEKSKLNKYIEKLKS